jgi:prephenate dehydrogenase
VETVAIVGVGLIGASFGLALKKAGFRGPILGVSSASAIRDGLARGAIDEAVSLEAAAARADLIYLSQPICRILETLRTLGPLAGPDCLITDAGSTKAHIVGQAGAVVQRAQFLGGHPMAGKETRGAGEAEADLFAGRTWVLAPRRPEELETARAREFRGWLEAIGAVPVLMAPEEHDRVVALTSHLPQLLSTALALTLSERLDRDHQLQAAGPGLAGTLRLAASSYDIWGDILRTNPEAIGAALDAFIERLTRLRANLPSEQARVEFEAANAFAGRLRRSLPL